MQYTDMPDRIWKRVFDNFCYYNLIYQTLDDVVFDMFFNSNGCHQWVDGDIEWFDAPNDDIERFGPLALATYHFRRDNEELFRKEFYRFLTVWAARASTHYRYASGDHIIIDCPDDIKSDLREFFREINDALNVTFRQIPNDEKLAKFIIELRSVKVLQDTSEEIQRNKEMAEFTKELLAEIKANDEF